MAMKSKSYRFETLCLHAGHEPDPLTRARAVPIHRTSSYTFRDTEHAANLFSLSEPGNIYTRMMNPTTAVLEERMAALEDGAAAVAVASGTSAIHYAVINVCRAGDQVVSANDLYGGTSAMFRGVHPQLGIETRFVDPTNPDNIAAAITDKTRVVFVESCGNPALNVPDFDRIAEIASSHKLPLIVDNTFPTPVLFNPIAHGATVVCHSLTKWLGGHGTGIGGVCIDSGKFDWTEPKFELFNQPNARGVRWGHDIGELTPVAFAVRLRNVPLRNLGSCISPDNAWMFLQGLETLSLRMERHCSNAMATAKYLQEHKQVEWVKYPGLPNHPTHDNAKKYFKGGFGGTVVFGIRGGSEAGRRFIEKLQLFSHLANVGDAKSLAIHPATTTHSQLTPEQQVAGGITQQLIRLSVGIEHIDDIIEDIEQALAPSPNDR